MSDATDAAADAIERARTHAVSEWYVQAERALHRVCMTFDTFTVREVRDAIPPHFQTHELRALGAVMKGAAGKWCEPTMEFVASGEKRNHSRPLRRWRSLVRG
jgi:hypothetical protein